MVEPGYGGLPKEYRNKGSSRIAIIPVPYDKTSTWVKGADRGPGAIIEASANMELYDIETDSEVCGKGIFTDEPVREKSSPERMIAAVEKRVKGHIKNGKFTVVIGGEHSVSIGAIRAHSEHFRDITVLQLDAHSDLRDEYEGSRYSHACAMARVKETCPIVQVGIRSMDSQEKENMDKGRVFFAEDIQGSREWIMNVVKLLGQRVYITIDLDVLDPSIMPSTGTPEPGGLSWYDVLALLKAVARERDVVGFDLVELCPNPGNRAPDFLAAKLIYKLLGYKFTGRE